MSTHRPSAWASYYGSGKSYAFQAILLALAAGYDEESGIVQTTSVLLSDRLTLPVPKTEKILSVLEAEGLIRTVSGGFSLHDIEPPRLKKCQVKAAFRRLSNLGEFAHDPGLSPTDRHVLLHLANFSNHADWVSAGTVAHPAGLKARTVQEALARLADIGLVKVIENPVPGIFRAYKTTL